jgi:hypothetical protein
MERSPAKQMYRDFWLDATHCRSAIADLPIELIHRRPHRSGKEAGAFCLSMFEGDA